MNLQIWRSVGPGEYTSVTEVVYNKTVADERIASVPVSMSVMAGDMVGFYVPDRQLEPHTLPDVCLTMYTTRGGPASSLNSLGPVVGPSPYISVVFVSTVHLLINTYCIIHVIKHGIFILVQIPLQDALLSCCTLTVNAMDRSNMTLASVHHSNHYGPPHCAL